MCMLPSWATLETMRMCSMHPLCPLCPLPWTQPSCAWPSPQTPTKSAATVSHKTPVQDHANDTMAGSQRPLACAGHSAATTCTTMHAHHPPSFPCPAPALPCSLPLPVQQAPGPRPLPRLARHGDWAGLLHAPGHRQLTQALARLPALRQDLLPGAHEVGGRRGRQDGAGTGIDVLGVLLPCSSDLPCRPVRHAMPAVLLSITAGGGWVATRRCMRECACSVRSAVHISGYINSAVHACCCSPC